MSSVRGFLLFVAAMFLQWWLNAHCAYWGAAPQVLFAATILIAARRGPVPAMAIGYMWGLFSDTLRADLFGADALLYALAGYAAGMVRRQIDVNAPEPLAVTVFLLTWAYALALGMLGSIFMKSFLWVGWVSFLTTPLMNALIAIAGSIFLDAMEVA